MGFSRIYARFKNYEVKITLSGKDGVHQEFRYSVINENGKISILKALTIESEKIIN
jgi:hypothetical protein